MKKQKDAGKSLKSLFDALPVRVLGRRLRDDGIERADGTRCFVYERHSFRIAVYSDGDPNRWTASCFHTEGVRSPFITASFKTKEAAASSLDRMLRDWGRLLAPLVAKPLARVRL